MRFSKKGFTLMELLVVITLIWIMTIWAMNMRFDISNSEKLNIFDTQVMNPIELARDFALIWKWITTWANLVIPEEWKIIISPSDWWGNLWSIETLYTINTVETSYSTYNVKKPFLIENVSCKLLDDTINDINWTDTITITFSWQNINIDSSNLGCQDNVKEIIITTNILDEVRWKITINKLSWVIQREKLLN